MCISDEVQGNFYFFLTYAFRLATTFREKCFLIFCFLGMRRFRLGLVVLAAITGVLKPRVLFQISVRF